MFQSKAPSCALHASNRRPRPAGNQQRGREASHNVYHGVRQLSMLPSENVTDSTAECGQEQRQQQPADVGRKP